ncbi:hypothetical protein [Methanogenium sp. MK-MG]|uniref:hypothetical protein n=1 Tax=Methanogenium sp. MK-MG TaxID=2599926 RepID=UPI0013ECD0FF|nr:hypothetical protein [Methanogenium sp. MK-MG]KAF1078604.1 hypothetical protein MKMG_00458 [Methanogenium sp. MK-MG]
MIVKLQQTITMCLLLALVAGSPAAAAFVEVELDTNYSYLNTSFQYLKVDDLMQLDQTEMSIHQATSCGNEVKTITSPFVRNVEREFTDTQGTIGGATITIAEASSTVTIGRAYSTNVFTDLYVPAFAAKIPGKEGVIGLGKYNNSAASGDFTTWGDCFRLQEAMYFFAGATDSEYEGIIYRIDPPGGPVNEGIVKVGATGPYYDPANLGDTLTHVNNVVSHADYTTDRVGSLSLPRPTTDGKYAVSALAYFPENETFHVHGGLPVIIMDGDRKILWNGSTAAPTFIQNVSEDVTVTFDNIADISNMSYALVNTDEQYDAIVHVDTTNLLEAARTSWQNLIPSSPAMPQILEDGIRSFGPGPDGAYTYAIKLTSEPVYPPFATDKTLAITPGYGISDVERNGNSIVIPAEQLDALVPGNYQLYALGTDAEYDMLALDQLSVVITEIMTQETDIKAGWNMISVDVVNDTPVFPPGFLPPLFIYNITAGNYDTVPVDEIIPGKGYWAASNLPGQIIATGVPLNSYTVPLETGWNMVGSLSRPVAIADATVVPEGSLIPDSAYWYNTTSRKYDLVETINPGDGIWLNAGQDCTFSLSI